MTKIIKNATLFDDNGNEFVSDIEIKDGKFSKIERNICCDHSHENIEYCDVCGKYILPGLCDIHTHGARLCDFTVASVDEILNTASYYAQNGVTMLFPTTVSAPFEQLKSAVKNITAASKICKTVHMPGIHIEGPYLSHKKRGAHLESYLTLPKIDEMLELQNLADGLKLRVTVAPEVEGGIEFIEQCTKNGILVSLGHSDADNETLKKAIDKGADCFTHLYNAMGALHHREPGCVGTALLEDVYCELICDGIHVHPETVRLTRKIKDKKVVLVTDSIQAAGLTKSDDDVVTFMSAGKPVTCKGDIARTDTGELAGSTLGLFYGFYNYMHFSKACTCEACNAASLYPAKAVGMDDRFGKIRVGASADFLVYDSAKPKKQALRATYCAGNLTYECKD